MTAEWSLTYDDHGRNQEVPSVDEAAIERVVRRLDGVETCGCGLTNFSQHNWITCRGGPDRFIVEYLGVPPGYHCPPGFVPGGVFLLGRKNDANRDVVQVRWKTVVFSDAPNGRMMEGRWKPDRSVLVDVRADSVLTLPEVITIFITFFKNATVHPDFTTIPKPPNGYLR